jgi:lipoprotein NlpI
MFGGCADTQAQTQTEKARGLLQTANTQLNADKLADAGLLAQQAAEAAPDDAGVQMRAGEILFLSGKVAESIPCFDAANKLDPQLAPHNWQRGVALGCLGKFQEGADQFRTHHDVNPNDVENSAWYFLCVAKTKGREAAEATVIPSGGDRRQPMMSVLKMLQGTLKPDEVLEAAKMHTNEGQERKMAMFYGFLYVGIYYDSIGDSEKAAAALDKSIEVAQRDYMGRTARLYREIRFPKIPSSTGDAKGSPSK